MDMGRESVRTRHGQMLCSLYGPDMGRCYDVYIYRTWADAMEDVWAGHGQMPRLCQDQTWSDVVLADPTSGMDMGRRYVRARHGPSLWTQTYCVRTGYEETVYKRRTWRGKLEGRGRAGEAPRS
eukprot:2784134-Rhodomonas_salina.1